MIILRNKHHGEFMRVCMEYLRPLLGIKNTVKFSIKIPHITSTLNRLLSDRLLCWREPISASYTFLGLLQFIDLAKPKSGARIFFFPHFSREPISVSYTFLGLLHKRSPRRNTRSEEWKMQAETTGWAQIQGRVQAHILQFHFNSLPIQSSPWNRRWAAVCFQNPSTFTATNETSLVTLPPLQTERLLSTLYKLLWSLSPTWLDYLWSTTKVLGERRISQVCRYFCWLSEKRKLLTCNVNLYVCE